MARFFPGLRACLLALAVLAMAGAGAQEARANPKYASIVIDAATGEVLRERYADKRLYPASLTKMMTLYMTFDAIKRGKLTLDTRIRISANAAAEPASKIGLRKGNTITVRDAIQACATKSANDAATALAEAIGGSEARFARMMTEKARSIGMRNTTFRNAHGLTNKGQKSTARDMSRLGRRLLADFPEHAQIFARKKFRYKGRSYRATNKMLHSYEGVDGIKTGYTRASGYNLVASADRNGETIIGVVFGGRSGTRRNRHMALLLDEGFAKLAKLRESRTLVASPLPRRRPGTAATLLASAPPLTLPTAQPVAIAALRDNRDPWVVAQGLLALQQVVAPSANAAQPPKAAPAAKAPGNTAGKPAARPAGPWAVQVGAYRNRKLAQRMLDRAKAVRTPQLSSASPVVSERKAGGRPIYRARFVGLERKDAKRACATLERRGIDCFALQPNG